MEKKEGKALVGASPRPALAAGVPNHKHKRKTLEAWNQGNVQLTAAFQREGGGKKFQKQIRKEI